MAVSGVTIGNAIHFPPFRLDPDNERLERAGVEVPLRPKTLAVLCYLAERPGRLVRKNDLLDAIWPDTYVGDGVVKVCVREIREALGDNPKSPQYVETVSRRGYRFIAQIVEGAEAAPPPHRAPSSRSPLPQASLSQASLSQASKPQPPPGFVSVRSPPGQRRIRRSSGSFPLPGAGGAMVGRHLELRRMGELLAAALQGERQLVFVTGQPGIGKTTLVDAFLQGLDGVGELWVATGQCLESYGAGEAYMPLLETLNRLCQGPRGHEVIDLLRHRAPSWLVQLPWLVDEAAQEELRNRTFGLGSTRMLREMVETLEALSALSPLVLVLEDLHWSDGSTLDLLSALARRPEPGRLMIVGTFRPAELEARHPLDGLRQDLLLHGLCNELELEPLSAAEVEEYLEGRFMDATGGVPPGLSDLIQLRTDGLPLFVVHLTEHVTGHLEAERGKPLSTLLESGEFRVPGSLRVLIEGLIRRLKPEEQSLLEAASVAGVQFSAVTVAAGLKLEVDDVEAIAEGLARRGTFVRSSGTVRWPDGTVAGRYKFVHSLFQNVLYHGLAEAPRIRLHRRIGECLEEGFAESSHDVAGELAMHFERGHDLSRAVKYREQAAQKALYRNAYREAIVHLGRGLGLLEALPEGAESDRQELSLRIALGPALMATRGFAVPEARQNYERAQALCTEIGETPDLFPALWGLWMSHWMRAEHQASLDIGRRCLELAEATGEDSLKVLAHRSLGATLFDTGDLPVARRHLESSLKYYKPPARDDRSTLRYTSDSAVFVESFRAHILWLQGFADQARAACRHAREIAERIEHPFSQSLVRIFSGTIHWLCGDSRTARRNVDAALELTKTHGFALFRAAAEIRHGLLLVEEGDTESGLRRLRRGIETWTATGAEQWRPLNLLLLASAALSARRFDDGLEAIGEALEIRRRTGERWCLPELYRLDGELRLRARGSAAYDEAEDLFRQALEEAGALGTPAWELRAAASRLRLAQQRGQGEGAARSTLEALCAELREGEDTGDVREARRLLGA